MGSAEQLGIARHRSVRRAEVPFAVSVALIVLAGLCRCVLLTGVALASWSVLPSMAGFETTTVMSGSMTPGFPVGDAVVTRPVARADLSVGQVLLFDDPDEPGALRMHRLVRARGDVLVTKGDANDSVDSTPIHFAAVRGVGVIRVPFAGLPSYWVRTGQPVPVIGLAVAAVLLVSGSRLDRRHVRPRHVDRAVDAPRRRMARHRWGTIVPILVIGAVCAPAASDASIANASFATKVSNGPSTFTGCVDFPVRGTLPSSALAYFNYMETTGSTTANRAVPGTSVGTFGTVLRRDGICATDQSPYITVGTSGPSGLIAPTASSVPNEVTIATWFRTSTKSGTIADLGSNPSGGGSSSSNLVLYMSTTGSVVFGAVTSQAAGIPIAGITCQSPGGNADGGWHLVIATFSSTAGCTVGIDGATPAPGTAAVNATPVNLQLLSGFAGYWRLGYDTIGTFWPNVGPTPQFQGDLDESQVYSTVLSTTDQSAIALRRH